jgi:hypothetical protein
MATADWSLSRTLIGSDQHARRLDSGRYLRVDALPTSRSILEKYGFTRVASTSPADSRQARMRDSDKLNFDLRPYEVDLIELH